MKKHLNLSKLLLLLALMIIFPVVNNHLHAQVSASDRNILIDLYKSTNGADWTNKWDTTSAVNTWYGVSVSANQITEIRLKKNNLSGSIPSTLGGLSSLLILDLDTNQITGTIPVELKLLTNLTLLYLNGNQLEGSIPSEFSLLAKLKWLNLSGNQLSGIIPEGISGLQNLELLYLDNNNFTDEVPTWLSQIVKLKWLKLGSNQFSGTIPTGFSELDSLELLYLDNNLLSGPIPGELGQIATLQWLNLSHNQLMDTIPAELFSSNLSLLYLNHNQIIGSIPKELGQMTNLEWLYLNKNQFTGSVPVQINQLNRLKIVNIDSTQLVTLPDLSALDSLEYLTVSNNKFTFEDLEYNMNINETVIFVYSPQDSIGTSETVIKSEGETFTYTLTTGGTSNSYQWYKDGVILPAQTTETIEINNLTVADAGNYYCKVSNALVPGLTLTSRVITLLMNYCVDITFGTGWNIFSSPGIPAEPDMETIFQPFVDDKSLVKIQDEEGNSLEDLGIYGGWKNNIGDITLTEGYKVKMSAANSVLICGQMVKYPYPIPLKTGWNIIGYPQATAFDGQEVVQQLIDREVLIKVQDKSGNSIEDLGIYGDWKNDIGNFLPGEGFKIKVIAPDTLWIYNGYSKSNNIQPELITTTHFQPAFEGNGVDHMNIYLVNFDGSGISEGDEIGIFDGNICVGAKKITKQNSSYINLIASAADGNVEKANGVGNGRDIILKLYRNGKEYPLSLQPVNNASLRFEKNGSIIVMANKDVSTGIEITGNESDVNCYPNPFYESINIEINLQNEEYLNVEIYDMYSRKIRQLQSGKANGAIKLQWDGNDERGNKVATGVYFLRVNKTWKKVMLNGN